MEHLPADGGSGGAVIDMGPDRSVLILIKHCRDMKQQEARLRLITLLLLLSCSGLFCICFVLKRTPASSGQTSTEQSAAFSEQRLCSTDDAPQQTLQPHRWHIQLKSLYEGDMNTGQYLKWEVMFGGEYNAEKRAISIVDSGVYFVHVKFDLSCHKEKEPANFRKFMVELHSWNEGYGKRVTLTNAWDGVTCPSGAFRTVVVEELLELIQGDYVSVWIEEGYELITKSSFGAFYVSKTL